VNPVRFSVERPHTIAVAVILALLFSWLAFEKIPVQLKPTVDVPIITIETVYLGASAVEVEEQVTRVIEDVVQNCEGVDELTSTSSEGYSSVSLEYEWGIDKDAALIDVINKLAELPTLPPDAEKPVVSLVPPMQREAPLWLVSRSPYEPGRVRQIVEDQVEPFLKRVPGVGGLLVFGGEEREIQVRLDPQRMVGLSIGFGEVETALARANVNQRGGTIETPGRQMVVRTEGRALEPAEIAAIVLRRDGRGTVLVSDVAEVLDTHRERSSVVRGDGVETIAIGVLRQAGSNVVEMIAACDAEIASVNRRLADKGLDLRFEAVYRDTTYLNDAIEFVSDNLVEGSLLSIAALLIFLRSFRSVLVISLSIPICLGMVFLVLEPLGRTLNVISLAGLAFASGVVVDNATVVLENFFRHLELGKRPGQAAIDGGREVWGGILAGTLTQIAVFLPVLGIQEEAGQLFADLALTIAASVAISLPVALLVVPPLCDLLWKHTPARAGEIVREGPLGRSYSACLRTLTARGSGGVLLRLGFTLGVAAVSVAMLRLAPAPGYLPSGNSNLIFYVAQPIPSARIEQVARNFETVERWIRAQPETGVYFSVAANIFNGGGIILEPEYADAEGLADYEMRMMMACSTVPGFLFLVPMRFSLFNDPGSQFEVHLSGPDLAVLNETAGRMSRALQGQPGVKYASSSYVEGRPELSVQVDARKAVDVGLSVAQIGAIVEIALAGRRVSLFSEGGRDYDVNLVVPQEGVRSQEELERLPIVTPSGRPTRLGEIATIVPRTGPVAIQRRERQRTVSLTVNLLPDAVLGDAIEAADAGVVAPARASLPAAYTVELGGTADKLSSTLQALTRSFWLAVLVTYLLLVALFRSWLSPIVIMITVPLATSGGVLALWIGQHTDSGVSFDVLTMLGFVIQAGVVVNNAILIVHQANNFAAEGMARREALYESSRTRLRPIAMTVLTTVTGLIPLAIGGGAGAELYQGLAVVMLGGLIVSTLFSLVLVPVLMTLGYDAADALRRRPSSVPAPIQTA
jgi:hydrophobic/amphiphilic exporter-1 (mainly G- bacteria), HAE1 family